MREKIMEEIKQTSTVFKTTQDLKNKKCEICEIGKLTDKINNQLNNEMECQNYLHFKDDIIDCNKELFEKDNDKLNELSTLLHENIEKMNEVSEKIDDLIIVFSEKTLPKQSSP